MAHPLAVRPPLPGPAIGPRGPRVARLLAAALCGLMLVSACERLPTRPAATRVPLRGVTFVSWSAAGYVAPQAAGSLDALAATGGNLAVIVVTAYQADPAGVLRPGDPRTPTEASVRDCALAAQARGLEVALKPHVDLDGGAWRDAIAPAHPAAWFEAYRDFVLTWATLAQAVGARQFVVGTELAGTLAHADEWRETIRRIRAVYSGELVYAASWDEAARVPFWRELDRVGVDYYFPVTRRREAGRLEMLAGWQPWLVRLERLHRQAGRPLVLTEIGYRSVDGAGMQPSSFSDDEPLDLGEQADLYWAALQATGDVPWIAGLYWWNWPADGAGGPADRDYTPSGKPAARELAAAWARP